MKEATELLLGLSVAAKNELLFRHGINFNDLPSWQKRGSAVYWESFEKEGRNPTTGDTVVAMRWRLKRDLALPMGDDYSRFVERVAAG